MNCKWGSLLKNAAVWAACLGTALPASVWASDPAPTSQTEATAGQTAVPAPVVQDVALQNDDTLQGQVIDESGSPTAGAPVSVVQGQQVVANLTTDQNGAFQVPKVRGGVYRLVSLQGEGTYRAWPKGSAPPSASSKAVITNVQYRGDGRAPIVRFFTNPWVLGAIVATAIAVPVALANRDHGSGS